MIKHFIHSDEDVIDAILKNHKDIMKSFYLTHYRFIELFILNNNGDQADAQKVFQEGVIMLIRSIKSESFQPHCSLRTFLYSICRRQWYNELKNRTDFVFNFTDNEAYIEFDDQIEERFDAEEFNFERTDEALLSLQEPANTLLMDFYVNRKSIKDIKDQFGYSSEKNVTVQIDKAMTRLCKFFGEE